MESIDWKQLKAAQKAWWRPIRTDAAWLARLREDYPENAHMSDDSLRNYYGGHQVFATTWDHVGDAYAEYEPLAEWFLTLEAYALAARAQLEAADKLAARAKAITGREVSPAAGGRLVLERDIVGLETVLDVYEAAKKGSNQ